MRDLAYEDLEAEATRELAEHEKYEAECARPFLPTPPFKPTPTRAELVLERAELTLERMRNDETTTFNDRELCRMIIALAKAIDER